VTLTATNTVAKRRLRKLTLHRLHRWTGLFAGLWLAVLGVSGFILDHRDNWRWLWQDGMSGSWLPQRVVEKSERSMMRIYQMLDDKPHLVGGPTGLWWRDDAEKWQKVFFIGDQPRVTSVVRDSQVPGSAWWLATDNGLWRRAADGDLWMLIQAGPPARQIALAGQHITALTAADENSLWGVVDRSRVFRYDRLTGELHWIALSPLGREVLPATIDLSRLVHDVHFGRGVFSAPWSLLWNDMSGFALLLLPLSGLLYWWLPRIWRHRREQGWRVSKICKQRTARWLYRFHAPILGLVCLLPLVYLSISGIMLDHSELRRWMKQISLSQQWLPPVYDMPDWQNEIYNLMVTPGVNHTISLGTRMGLFSTDDDGLHWRREILHDNMGDSSASFVWMTRQLGQQRFIGGMGGPNYQQSDLKSWKRLPHAAHMPTDVTLMRDGRSVWKTSRGVFILNGEDEFTPLKVNLPQVNYVPWFYVLDGLHSGVLIHVQWKWMNDLFALLALALVTTGMIRWWRIKWL